MTLGTIVLTDYLSWFIYDLVIEFISVLFFNVELKKAIGYMKSDIKPSRMNIYLSCSPIKSMPFPILMKHMRIPTAIIIFVKIAIFLIYKELYKLLHNLIEL